MRKLIAWFCMCTLLITLTPQLAFAEGEPGTANGPTAIEKGWRYKTDISGSYAAVMEYAGGFPADGIVTVPETLGGKPVEALGYQIWDSDLTPTPLFGTAFQKGVKVLNLPSSTRLISEYAFEGLSSLTEVNISDGTYFKSVDGVLYDNNNGVERLSLYPASKTSSNYTIPATTVEIASGAFVGSKHLKQITIPSTVRSIGDTLFQDSRSLESVSFENSMSALPSSTFQGCQNLTSVTFQSGLTSIGEYAFDGAASLESISIPSTVTTIGDNAFSGCISLNNVTWAGNSTTAIGSFAFAGTKSLRSISLPTGLTSIEDGTFISSGIRTVTIPPNVRKIGTIAFSNCVDLTLVNLPSTRLEIWLGAFSYTPSLTGINFDSTQSVFIDDTAFASSGLERVNLTNKVSLVGPNSFALSKNLRNISIGSNIEYLPVGIFSSLEALEKVYIPQTVIAIDDHAFAWDNSLADVYFTGNAPAAGVNGVNVFHGAASGFKVHYPTDNTTFNIKDGKWRGYTAEEYTPAGLPSTYNFSLNAGSGGLIVGGVSGAYEANENITVRAQALPGYTFSNWSSSNGGSFDNASSASTVFTMNSADTSVTANFVQAASAETPVFSESPESPITVSKGEVPNILLVPAEVSDGGTITYQWYENSVNSNSGGTAIAGATNVSYLPPTTETGTFYYYVVATNTNSFVSTNNTATATSGVIEVNVIGEVNAATPVIRDNISGSASYAKNANVSELKIFAYAPDYGRITYQWYKNTTNSTTGGTAIDGATLQSYIPPSSTEGTFYYYAEASNYNKFSTGMQVATTTSGIKTIVIGSGVNSGNNNSVDKEDSSYEWTEKPASGTENASKLVGTTIEIKVEVSNDIAKVSADSDTLNATIEKAVFEAAKKDTPIKVTIVATGSNDTKGKETKAFEFTLPTASLAKLAEAGKASFSELEMKTPIATTSFDNKALEQICANAGTKVSFSVKSLENDKLSDTLKSALKGRPVYDFALTSEGKSITSLGKGRAKITLPYVLKNGEDWSHIVINYVDSNGKQTTIKESKHADREHTITFITDHFSMYSINSNQFTFTDINNEWYSNAVDFVTSHGLFAGMGEGKFSPEVTMTRGMFVTVLANLDGKASNIYYPNVFSDVDPSKYYAKPIAWATSNKIVAGVSEGKFAPDAKITREEMAVMLYSYIQYKGIYIDKAEMQPFDDSDSVSTWAKKGVNALQGYRIVVGENNKYSPKDNATRAQVAAIFTNFIDAITR